MAVVREALAKDDARQHVQGGEQRRRAVALVVVGHRARPAGLHRQTRWVRSSAWIWDFSSTESTTALSGGPTRTRQWTSLSSMGVVGEFEGLYEVGFQSSRRPDLVHRRLAHAGRLCHRAHRPFVVSGGVSFWVRATMASTVSRGSSAFSPSRAYLSHLGHPVIFELAPPLEHASGSAEALGDLLVGDAFGSQQQALGLTHGEMWLRGRRCDLFEQCPVFCRQLEWCSRRMCHDRA